MSRHAAAPTLEASSLRPCAGIERAASSGHDGHEAREGHHDHDHGHAGHDHAGHDHAAHDHAGHDHAGHGHSHDHSKTSATRLGIALALTAGFMGVEAAVGWWSGSLSLLADAGALAMAIAAQRIATRPRTLAQTYGYRRAEVLAAFVNGVVLVAVTLGILFEAVHRLGNLRDVEGHAMSVTAAAGLAVNIIAAFVLAGGSKGNVNIRAALAHVISDALGSVGALVAGVLVATFGFRWADPAASIVISLLIAYGSWKLVRETTHVLMQGTPQDRDASEVEKVVRAVEGVVDVHDLHVWRVSDGLDVLTVHVVVEDEAAGTDVARRVTETLRTKLGIAQATVQPESRP